MSKALGRQLMVELYGCSSDKLDDLIGVEDNLVTAAIVSGATVVEQVFHRFAPQGVSGVVVIAESHLAIHTWPEYGYAAVDLFTCGEEVDPMKGFEYLREAFEAKEISVVEVKRGLFADPEGNGRHKPDVSRIPLQLEEAVL
ncbi:adenosylmethionine decarboxylase [bacterium]|nr:adenosylmethionine decarboxylase [bacterium]